MPNQPSPIPEQTDTKPTPSATQSTPDRSALPRSQLSKLSPPRISAGSKIASRDEEAKPREVSNTFFSLGGGRSSPAAKPATSEVEAEDSPAESEGVLDALLSDDIPSEEPEEEPVDDLLNELADELELPASGFM